MKRTVCYRDEWNDDFSPSKGKIKLKKVEADFPYEHKSILWNAAGFFLYRLVATPLVFLFCKITYGLRVRNRRNLRKLRGGFFLYANHTNMLLDSFFPTLISFPRRCSILTSADAVSIPGLRNVVQMLGGIPLPQTPTGGKRFLACLHGRAMRRQAVMVYPEAHVWQYYNGVRPFRDGSFAYPVRENLPVVGAAVVYRPRRFLKNLPPLATVVIGKPVYPDRTVSKREARRRLRDEIYRYLSGTVKKENSFAFVRYVKAAGPAEETRQGPSRPDA